MYSANFQGNYFSFNIWFELKNQLLVNKDFKSFLKDNNDSHIIIIHIFAAH